MVYVECYLLYACEPSQATHRSAGLCVTSMLYYLTVLVNMRIYKSTDENLIEHSSGPRLSRNREYTYVCTKYLLVHIPHGSTGSDPRAAYPKNPGGQSVHSYQTRLT